ncbi:hypothetical protein [Sanguibacter inulinus]|jgi:hypothetical protein|uniref:Uncharacterized protein n=1 Tax=Sanguibacter inulinus TaxID=60922 RepID=A0A853ERP5_9MICO|nr:hypothetical protein [Sanguibacter inulinus]MBF0721952.1 hypothetical protein [Sanguibacter inulinus]NYS93097.1 hypothetical protein [Sanguibacter inulinus]
MTSDCDAAGEWRQGDHFDLKKIFITEDGKPVEIQCNEGVVLISQTCDVVIPTREYVQVARVSVEEPSRAGTLKRGNSARWIPMPSLGRNEFLDLDLIATVRKSDLSGLRTKALIDGTDNKEVRDFAQCIARKFGRFAFPDHIVPALQPIQTLLRGKSARNSNLAKVVSWIHEMRVSADDWFAPDASLTLYFILDPGHLPLDMVEGPRPLPIRNRIAFKLEAVSPTGRHIKDSEKAVLRNLHGRSPQEELEEVCLELSNIKDEPEALATRELDDLWFAFRSLVSKICEVGSDSEITVEVDAVAIDEFTMLSFVTSESLDLSHLSSTLIRP